ncbi:MAG: N-6 DNA methylase [Bacteroidota bacterium]|nr:N-6 DNA methylase [Bacteroidota bacterium]
MEIKKFIVVIGFSAKENTSDIFSKKYKNKYAVEVDLKKQTIHFGGKIKIQGKDSQNITKVEDLVVLECVNRLLEKGYKPEHISLEKVYPAGHGFSGRLDVCVTHEDGSEYLLIECKTYGKEFDKEFTRIKKDGGQLFTYFKFSNKADLVMLYTSELNGKEIIYKNEIVKIEEEYKSGDVKDFYEKWNKLTKDNGVFDSWVKPYNFESKALTINDLEEIRQEDSGFIFNRFLEILRHNVVSDKGNAFNRIFTLFLCKIYDEKINEGTDNELGFQWLEGIDDHRSFQIRLTDLYKNGMYEFLEKVVTDFSETEFNNKYFKDLTEDLRNKILDDFNKIRLEKNNEFAIKDVYDEQSFNENAIVVKEIVELLQKFKLRYTKKQQYLSDFFELLLTTGLKQESGQFFTPVPVAQFVIKSLPIDTILEAKLAAAKIDNDTLLPYVMDYAAGSGHFLTETMHELQRLIKNKDNKKYHPSVAKKIRNWQDDHFAWAIDYVYGIEKDYRLVKVGKVGCYLHGDGLANVIHSDGLARFNHPDYKGKLLKTDKDFPQDNKQFDIIVSNPPYSVSAFKNAARSFYKNEDFELYNKLTDTSSEIECLFIERTKQLLKDGGVAGIILPSSILSNTGIYSKSRELILQYFDIVGITELGSNTFMATGTNTVTLFLRRRNNYESINLKIAVKKFFTALQDVTLNGIEKPVTKYVNHVWEGIKFTDYVSLLQKAPNKNITEHEIYIEYKKKLKAKNDKEFWTLLLEKEADKLFYFIIAYPQKVVLVKSGEKDAEKHFLGYEFSNRRGSEGIHPIQRGKNIEDCTELFDPEIFDNPEKASTYIYKAFQGDFDSPIDEAMQNNVTRHNLVDMLTFDRVDFEKNISLALKKKVKIESKWDQVRLEDVAVFLKRGKSTKYGNSSIQIIKSGQARGYKVFDFSERHYVEDGFILDERKLEPGDILINSSGVGTAGRVTLFNLKGIFVADSHITILRSDKSQILPDYILQSLASIGFKTIEEMAMGQSGQIELTIQTIANIKIPLPPKNIQEKIVKEIEALEGKEGKAVEEVETLKNSINSLFSKNSKVPLKSLLAEINPSKSEVSKFSNDTDVSFLSMADVSNQGEIVNLQKRKLREVKTGFTFFQEGDVLVAKITPCTENGKGALVSKLQNNIGFGSTEFFVLRANKEKLLPKILFHFTQSKDFRNNAEKVMTGASGHRRVPKSFIENYEILLPPLSEQKKIVSEIEKIEKKIAALEKQISLIPRQKEAVLKKYL